MRERLKKKYENELPVDRLYRMGLVAGGRGALLCDGLGNTGDGNGELRCCCCRPPGDALPWLEVKPKIKQKSTFDPKI